MCFLLPLVFAIGAVASLALMVTAFATPDWALNPETGFSTGLNTYCNWTICYAYGKGDKYGTFMAVLFFIWFSMVFLFGNTVFHAASTYYTLKDADDFHPKLFCKVSSIAFAITGAPGVIAMAIFTLWLTSPPYLYGYSYYLGWVSCGVNCMFALLTLTIWTCYSIKTCKKGDVHINDSMYLESYNP